MMRSVLIFGCSLFVASPLSAGGAVQAHLRYEPLAGPVLAGGAAVWAERQGSDAFAIREAVAGSAPRTVFRYRVDVPLSSASVALSGSSGLLAVQVLVRDLTASPHSQLVQRRVFLGPPGGPLESVSLSCPLSIFSLDRSTDVAGSAAVYLAGGADELGAGRCGAELRTATATIALPDAAQGPRLTARFVSWLSDWPAGQRSRNFADLTVRDRESGADVTHVAGPSIPGQIGDLALDNDGEVAISWGQSGDGWTHGALGVVRLGASSVTRLPVPLGHYVPKLVNGRLIALTSSDGRGPGSIDLFDARGRFSRSVAVGAYDSEFSEQFDFNGTSVVWTDRACGSARILMAPVDGPFDQAPNCPLALKGRPRILRRRLKVPISCGGVAPKCQAALIVRLGSKHGVMVAHGTSRPGGLLNSTLSRATLHRLADRAHVKLWISGRVGDDGFEAEFHRETQQRSAVATLAR